MKKICLIIGLLMALVLALTAVAEAVQPPVLQVEAVWDSDMPEGLQDQKTLMTGYAGSRLGLRGYNLQQRSTRENLTELEQKAFDMAKEHIDRIAAGKETSTRIELDLEALGMKKIWTDEDFGVPVLDLETGEWIDKTIVQARMEEFYQGVFDTSKVLRALIRDNPFGFYWMDNHVSYKYTQPWKLGYSGGYDGYNASINIVSSITMLFPVDVYFADSETYTTDPSKTAVVDTAVQRAASIRKAGEGKGDVERMTYYMQQIRALSEYDHPAAEDNYINTQPWQLIHVFDGDPETKVVCEGYSKAFKYLCDDTKFIDRSLEVYSVSGNMDGGAHMWNIVHIGGSNYLVDVTNCVTNGSRTNSLFLSLPESGSVASGYSMRWE